MDVDVPSFSELGYYDLHRPTSHPRDENAQPSMATDNTVFNNSVSVDVIDPELLGGPVEASPEVGTFTNLASFTPDAFPLGHEFSSASMPTTPFMHGTTNDDLIPGFGLDMPRPYSEPPEDPVSRGNWALNDAFTSEPHHTMSSESITSNYGITPQEQAPGPQPVTFQRQDREGTPVDIGVENKRMSKIRNRKMTPGRLPRKRCINLHASLESPMETVQISTRPTSHPLSPAKRPKRASHVTIPSDSLTSRGFHAESDSKHGNSTLEQIVGRMLSLEQQQERELRKLLFALPRNSQEANLDIERQVVPAASQ